ncbi:BTB/POZ domain-containing protein 9-like [Wyeomyia smithii]|uniref:BTB/POZ domain-containing protein 9-like n=1 Tax=Wyeomyia smithii TaxID=174621 RepID=UPI002467B2DF|nr:BTB/POZ domain-containing protein 9-like [Wyeomyia smithii]
MASPLAENTAQEFLFNDESSSDVTFLVGQQKTRVYAHRQLLIGRSEYFAAMFGGSFRESSESEISLENIDEEDFLEMLHFLYNRKFRGEFVHVDRVNDLYVSAKMFLMDDMVDALARFLADTIDYDNVLQVFVANQAYEFKTVDETCLSIILNDPIYYFEHQDFRLINRERFRLILEASQINCTEKQLLKQLNDWKLVHETDDVKELENIITSKKRTTSCRKSILYEDLDRLATIECMITCSSRAWLCGVGIHVQSRKWPLDLKEKITICVHVWTKGVSVVRRQFHYESNEARYMKMIDLFFPEVMLCKGRRYSFAVHFYPYATSYWCRNIRFRKDGGPIGPVAYYYYKLETD